MMYCSSCGLPIPASGQEHAPPWSRQHAMKKEMDLLRSQLAGEQQRADAAELQVQCLESDLQRLMAHYTGKNT